MVNDQLVAYIKQQLAQGLSKETIQNNLTTAGGWTPVDTAEAFAAVGGAQGISTPNIPTPPVGTTSVNVAPSYSKVPVQQTNNNQNKKKHHFLSSIIFFILILIANFVFGFIANTLSAPNYILGIFVVTVALTAIFALVAFIIRKIAGKFGKKWSFILWIFIILVIIAGGWIYVSQLKTYVYTSPGAIYLSNNQISLDQCISSTDEAVKYACGTNYAIQLKDRSICLKVYGNNDQAYYCQYNYDSYYNTSPTDISECQSMVTSADNGAFYKDGCFTSVAVNTFNKQVCSSVSNPDGQSSCVAAIDSNTYAKNNLCGPLYTANHVPMRYECEEYVYNQLDVNKCNLLTPQQGDKNACVAYVKSFDAAKNQYDAKNQAAPGAISAFENQTNLKTDCKYRGVGPGTIFDYSGQCKYTLDQNNLTAEFTNSSDFPLLFSSSTLATIFDTTGFLSKSCVSAKINSIDGGHYFSAQIDTGETFLLNLTCTNGSFGNLQEIQVRSQVTSSGQDGNGSLTIDFGSAK